MLNWIRELAMPSMPQLLQHGQGGRAIEAAQVGAGATVDWLRPVWAHARLQSLVSGPAPLTLFVPTDAALRQAGMTPQALPISLQQQWLMCHLAAIDDPAASLVRMMDGSLLRREGREGRDGGSAWRDASGARVCELRQELGSGGLRLRVVDRALQPASATLWEQVAADPGLARFADALDRTGLAPLLGCAGPFTVFAPSNAGLDRAAARLGMSRRSLWSDPARLGELLRQHVVPGRWSSLELPWGAVLRTWTDTPLQLTPLGLLRAGGCTVQALAAGSDQPCRNGVLHRLHDALLPAG